VRQQRQKCRQGNAGEESIDGNKNSKDDATMIIIKTTIIKKNNNKPVARGDGDTDMKPQRHEATTSMAKAYVAVQWQQAVAAQRGTASGDRSRGTALP